VIGFGSPVAAPVSGPNTNFGTVIVGKSVVKTISLTANAALNVDKIESTGAAFVIGASSPRPPVALEAGQKIDVVVTFTPSEMGSYAANLSVATSHGTTQLALTGVGQSAGPVLSSSVKAISFGGTPIDSKLTSNVILSNIGAAALTIQSITLPKAPFSADGLPAVGTILESGAAVTISVTYAPTAVGEYLDHLLLTSTGGPLDLPLSGTAATPGRLIIEPLTVDYGKVPVGRTKSATFKLSNTGGSAITLNKSKPPALGPFRASSTLDEGTLLAPGASLVETVIFAPAAVGKTSDGWVFTASDGSGQKTVVFSGEGKSSGGLTGDYYQGAAFDQFRLSRTDTTLDFDWEDATPDPSIPDGQPYSVRWTGQVTARFSEKYTFSFESSGGVRVWIGGQLLIDQWTAHDREDDCAEIDLIAGHTYDVKVEYYNTSGDGRAALLWASDSQEREVVSGDSFGSGVPDPLTGGWRLNGTAHLTGTSLELTPVGEGARGSAFWASPMQSISLHASFDLTIDSGSGADGLTLAFANASTTQPTALGAAGGGLGYSGIDGIGVAFVTYRGAADPSGNFVGVTNGTGAAADQLRWVATSSQIPILRNTTHHVDVTARDQHLIVAIDGTKALDVAVSLPPEVLVGFTAASGGLTDRHAVSNVYIR
jgi:hypothetical protein